ncbi:hypothetical protein [Kiloniella litopenaei]|uniref:hypothetical protein n=1 Tax=Kiloniella litopenaei TaxID=1549748 RepID=UPI003BA91CA8
MTASVPIGIKFKGDPTLVKSSPAQVSKNDLAAPFALTEAKVAPHVKNYHGQCPADLGFRLTFKAQGKGTVKYRLVSELGAKGPVNSVHFNNDGHKIIDFKRHIGEPSGGKVNKLAINNSKQDGDLNGFKNALGGKNYGSWKVEVVEPVSSTSKESFYSWKCKPQSKFNSPTTLKQSPPKVKIDKIKAIPVEPEPDPKPVMTLKVNTPPN